MTRVINLLWLVALGAAWWCDSTRSLLLLVGLLLIDGVLELKAWRVAGPSARMPHSERSSLSSVGGGGAVGGASLVGLYGPPDSRWH